MSANAHRRFDDSTISDFPLPIFSFSILDCRFSIEGRARQWYRERSAVCCLLFYCLLSTAVYCPWPGEKRLERCPRKATESCQTLGPPGNHFAPGGRSLLLSYTPEGRSEAGPRDKPEVVRRSIEEFAQDRYGADILKVEVPVDVRQVEGTRSFCGAALWTRAQAKDAFRVAFSAAPRPFIFLSAGVSNDEFAESLELASEAGVPWSGVLCGRAIWQDGVPVYAARGLSALEEWLASEGRQRLVVLERCLQQATPWHRMLHAGSADFSPAN